MNLISSNHAALQSVCRDCREDENLSDLILGMRALLKKEKGVGLAAPQVGDLRRVILINYGSINGVILNPVISKQSSSQFGSLEGCLSFPFKTAKVKRYKKVLLSGFDEKWEPISINLSGTLSAIAQHEVDHLNGITII